MLPNRTKLISIAAATLTVSALCGAPAFAGFDEAQGWSFFSPQQPKAAPSSDARAEFQGDGFTTLRQNSHEYLDCVGGKGGRMSCKKM